MLVDGEGLVGIIGNDDLCEVVGECGWCCDVGGEWIVGR